MAGRKIACLHGNAEVQCDGTVFYSQVTWVYGTFTVVLYCQQNITYVSNAMFGNSVGMATVYYSTRLSSV